MAQKQVFALDSPMSDFLDVRLAAVTRQQYINRLGMFFDSLGLHGNLDEQSREFLIRAKKDIKWVQNGFKYFIRDKKQRAEKGELSKASVRNFYKPVKLFCKVHDIVLLWDKITMTLPTGRKFGNDRAPTHEEVQTVIEYPDRRIKPIVLVMCSTGIRVEAWEYLKWKHIEPMKRDGNIVAAKILVYAGENEQYFSFMTPEAFNALQEWMDYRKKSGEEINGESWVMRTLWNTTVRVNKTGTKMGTSAVRSLVMRALQSQHLRGEMVAHRHEFKANHGFRKFFQTNCEPKMKSLDVMTLMGQDTGLAASYNKPTVEMLLGEYLKAVDNLTIDKSRISQTVVEKVSENQQMLVAEMHSKDQEIHELKEQVEEIRDLYQGLVKTLNEAVDLREKVRANPQEFLEVDPFKFAAMQKGRHKDD